MPDIGAADSSAILRLGVVCDGHECGLIDSCRVHPHYLICLELARQNGLDGRTSLLAVLAVQTPKVVKCQYLTLREGGV